MSRSGSMTRPTWRSVSATTKLALPSSGAEIASTVYIALAERDRHGREQDPDRDQRDHHRYAVEDGLRGVAFIGVAPEVAGQEEPAWAEVDDSTGVTDE